MQELFRDGQQFARHKPEFAIHPGALEFYEPELQPILNSNFVEAMEGMRSFLVSILIAGYLLYRWIRDRRLKGNEHRLDQYIHKLLDIEQRQLALDENPASEDESHHCSDEIKQLQHLLDEVTHLRQEALREFSAHQLGEDRATDCFLAMCHSLSDKINAKLTRQRFDQCTLDIIAAIQSFEPGKPVE